MRTELWDALGLSQNLEPQHVEHRHVYPLQLTLKGACWSIPESPVLKGPCSAHIRLEIEYWTIQCMRATVSDF